MNNWKWVVVAIMALMTLLQCGQQKPLPTGYQLVYGDKEGAIGDSTLTTSPGTEQFFSRVINTAAASRLLLGNYANYQSAVYLKFQNFPDSVQIHSAILKLSIIENIGPTDSSFWQQPHSYSINCYASGFDWTFDLDPELYIPQLPFSESPFTRSQVAIDTSYIEVALDTTQIKNWADSTVANNGFWLQSPDADFITAFYAREILDSGVMPQMTIIYTYLDSLGAHLDTTRLFAAMDAYVAFNSEASLNLDPNYFYIGKGLAFRSFVKFDLQQMDTTMHINRALLKFTVSTGNSIRDAAGATDCQIYRLDEASWNKGEVNESPATAIYSGTLTDSTLTFDITATVQGWIGQKNPNYGLLVRSAAEATTIGRVAFYSSKTQSPFGPKLELYFTLPPQQEFDNAD